MLGFLERDAEGKAHNETGTYEVGGNTNFYPLKNYSSISIDLMFEVLCISAREQLTWSTVPAGTPASVYSPVPC